MSGSKRGVNMPGIHGKDKAKEMGAMLRHAVQERMTSKTHHD